MLCVSVHMSTSCPIMPQNHFRILKQRKGFQPFCLEASGKATTKIITRAQSTVRKLLQKNSLFNSKYFKPTYAHLM